MCDRLETLIGILKQGHGQECNVTVISAFVQALLKSPTKYRYSELLNLFQSSILFVAEETAQKTWTVLLDDLFAKLAELLCIYLIRINVIKLKAALATESDNLAFKKILKSIVRTIAFRPHLQNNPFLF